MSRDNYWRLGGVVIEPPRGVESIRTVGESQSVDAWLTPQSDSPSGAWPDHIERYETLRQYRPHAGGYAVGVDYRQRAWFREQHTRDPSLLVSLRPPADSPVAVGGWFLVAGCEDSTDEAHRGAFCRVGFELFYLAALTDYDSADAVRDALEADGI